MRLSIALPAIAAALLLGALAATAFASSSEAPPPKGPRVPVLLELYTSEGCSSCPSADALVDELSRAQPVDGVEVVALGLHVDYWNYLGWADPYSNSDFSNRQALANQALGRDGVFTPQALVNGRVSLVGSDSGGLRQALRAERDRPAAHVEAAARVRGDRVELSATVTGAPAVARDDEAEVWAALTESGLSTEVRRGENAGRTLHHAPVARRLVRLGQLSASPLSTSVALDPSWKRDRLKAVVFVQERRSRRVLGVAAAPLAEVEPAAKTAR